MSTSTPVRISNAHKYYNPGRANELHVMDNINLELPGSGMVAIFGPSGCGKTTLLNAVGGLDSINSGTIELFGQDIRKDTDDLRGRYIGYIFQNYNLNVEETVYENVAAALRLCGMKHEPEIADRVGAALKNVGMEKYAARTPDTLSGGQQQRVAIARALVKNPAIILADEPTGNLDEANTVLVMDILKEISRTHLVLLVTHEAKLVDFYCDRIIEIVDGRVQSDRKNEGANGYVRRNKNDIYLGEFEKAETETSGVTLTYYGEPTAPLHLSIVHKDGKLYLKTDNPAVKLLDEGSEIRLVEGVFQETPRVAEDGTNHNGHAIDMSRLTPVSGTEYGRLYHWKHALSAAWRENFSKKKKKSNRRLRVCLVLLAIVMVFISSIFASGLRLYSEYRSIHNDSLFYIPLDPQEDYTALENLTGQHGVDFVHYVGSSPMDSTERLNFIPALFVTAVSGTLTANAHAVSATYAEDLRMVAGSDIANSTDILITTAVADALLEASTMGYIDTYEDLIGLATKSYSPSSGSLRIAGVVESDEYFYYMDPVAYAAEILHDTLYSTLPVAAAGKTPLSGEDIPQAGEITYIHFSFQGMTKPVYPEYEIIPAEDVEVYPDGEDESVEDPYVSEPPVKTGEVVTILGKTFTITRVITITEKDLFDENGNPTAYNGMDTYYSFVLSDGDYVSLSSSIGMVHFGSFYGGYIPYEVFWYDAGEPHYTNHLMLHSSDTKATADFLTETLGKNGFLTPDDVLEESLQFTRSAAMAGVVSVAVVLALMCLCVFFIMRSSFMSRVREVGILRAIGVKKSNLIFRYAVETALLTLLTTVIGYLCTTWFVRSLSNLSLTEDVFYFPLWLAGGLLIIVCAAALFFGVLPAMILLRRTPSEILSKYDI